jgi:hypothetical protein
MPAQFNSKKRLLPCEPLLSTMLHRISKDCPDVQNFIAFTIFNKFSKMCPGFRFRRVWGRGGGESKPGNFSKSWIVF